MFSFSQHATPFFGKGCDAGDLTMGISASLQRFGVPTMVKTTQIDIHDYICVDIKTYILPYISLALMLSKYLFMKCHYVVACLGSKQQQLKQHRQWQLTVDHNAAP